MASDRMTTMNLADDGEGMVPLVSNKPSNAFVPSQAYNQPEKNVSQSKETMKRRKTFNKRFKLYTKKLFSWNRLSSSWTNKTR